jgi:hypothetical protein
MKNREKKVSAYLLIILAGLLVALIFLSSRSVAATDAFSLFDPPLTNEEKALYSKIGNDKKEIERFINTRLFMRKVASFVAELPKGVEYDPQTHGCPMPPLASSDFKYTADYLKNFDYKYTLNADEELLLFKIMISCSEKNARNHPVGVNCGAPVDKESILSQLTPPVSKEEIKLLDKANQCPASEIPKFLATRKYVRQIKKLIAELPAGGKLDPLKAPRVPGQFDPNYMVDKDDPSYGLVFQIFQAQLRKTLSDLAK